MEGNTAFEAAGQTGGFPFVRAQGATSRVSADIERSYFSRRGQRDHRRETVQAIEISLPPALPEKIRTGEILEAMEACNALPAEAQQTVKKVICWLIENQAQPAECEHEAPAPIA